MKKILLPIVILLMLCSCKTEQQIDPIVKQIKFNAETVWNGTEYGLNTATDKNLKTTVTVTSPERLRNLKFTFSGDVVFFYYLELEYKLNLNEISETSPIRVLFEGLKSANTKNPDIVSENGVNYIEYSVGDTKYLFILSESGLPLKITDKDNEKSIILKNVTILN